MRAHLSTEGASVVHATFDAVVHAQNNLVMHAGLAQHEEAGQNEAEDGDVAEDVAEDEEEEWEEEWEDEEGRGGRG